GSMFGSVVRDARKLADAFVTRAVGRFAQDCAGPLRKATMIRPRSVVALSLVATAAAAVAGAGRADSPPVGPLPSGPRSTLQPRTGELVAVALPKRAGGRPWRVARSYDDGVIRQVSEADVGSSVVLVFRARTAGSTTVTFALTRGDRPKAYESRRYVVRVR